ncbi:MAG: efflux RND transporter periplasmic adaptor subunit [Alphaproteobacteria bacterium]|nr:efflux RND transporter periplasmic adaptor subunit [Alphaproteobacteria bacterium]
MRKWLLIVLGLVACAAIGYGVRRSGVDIVQLSGVGNLLGNLQTTAKPEPPKAPQGQQRRTVPVEVARAATAQLSDDVATVGTLLAHDSVSVSAETSGRVAEILFEDGRDVTAGAPLFRLDSDLAKAALSEAKARLALAEANYGRNQALRKSGNVAQSAYDAALSELEVARSAVESAEVRLNKLTITAPFSGTLGFRTVSPGAYVNAGLALVRLDRVDRLKASFSVPELQQGLIAIGQRVEFSADALSGKTFAATVSAMDPAIDVNGRALKVHATVDNDDLRLRPGLLIRVLIKGPPREAVVVPESAVVQRGEASFVFLAANQSATEARVRIGKRMPGTVEIVEGVAEGADVIVAGNARLSEGTAIEIVPTRAGAE